MGVYNSSCGQVSMLAEELGTHCGSDITFAVNSDFKGLGILKSDRLVSSLDFGKKLVMSADCCQAQNSCSDEQVPMWC